MRTSAVKRINAFGSYCCVIRSGAENVPWLILYLIYDNNEVQFWKIYCYMMTILSIYDKVLFKLRDLCR